ncbi:hypothetical protein WJX73_008336 [Symbiochloris irregularis]|uniref:F-box domain-containing protein n=1 Tax=Symbiochloris irregularis TaxID=706552 RepID=A0AAW1NND3_9CHLO
MGAGVPKHKRQIWPSTPVWHWAERGKTQGDAIGTQLRTFCGGRANPWWQGPGVNNTPYLQACQIRSKLPEELSTGPMKQDECGPAVGMPKVALLYLTRGPMAHEQLWSTWFEQAAGLVRADCLGAALCEGASQPRAAGRPGVLEAVGSACRGKETTGPDVVSRQSLFSVYVHANPDFEGYKPKSPFYGRIIPDELRIQTGWGEHSTTEVVRRMLRLALRDPLNQRFLLVSETCIPLYPPTVLYASLMADNVSRINACKLPGWHRQAERWSNRMAQGNLTKAHWRKHWQWFEIMRPHAQIVADDEFVAKIYEEHCRNAWDGDQRRHRMCFSDEHYMSALLAYHGLDSETDCAGVITWADWKHGEIIHPKTYQPHEVNTWQLDDIRKSEGGNCDAASSCGKSEFHCQALPPEIFYKIFEKLQQSDLLQAELCCRSWYTILSDPQAVGLWGAMKISLDTLPDRIAHPHSRRGAARRLCLEDFVPTCRHAPLFFPIAPADKTQPATPPAMLGPSGDLAVPM